MKKTKFAYLILVCCMTAPGWAQPLRPVQTVEPSRFLSVGTQDLSTNSIIYAGNIVSFADWGKNSPAEKDLLVLYPGYIEPNVTDKKNGIETHRLENLTMYVSRTKALLRVSPSQIPLAKMINLDVLRKMDASLSHKTIAPNQFMPNVVAGKGPISNFEWCNQGGQWITRVKREVDLSYLNAKNRGAWCSDSNRSLCVESCFIFGKAWKSGVAIVNGALDVAGRQDEKKDYGIAMQSEFRYFLSEQEYGAKHPLSDLTGIKSPVRGILEQNIFYFNQIFQYGKLLSILQEDPQDNSKTIMTTYFVMGVNTHTLKDHAIVADVINGTSLMNTPTGLTAGVPKYMQAMTRAVASFLEGPGL